MNPTISVIIPFYERLDWLTEAVESVLNQTYQPLEIIVINDGSKEGVTDFLERYSDVIKYLHKENGGPASARNLGIEIAEGEYIAFLDSDDIWLEDKIKIQMEKMLRYECVWSCCGYEMFGSETGLYMMTPDKSDYIGNDLSRYTATPTVVIKADILRNNCELRFNKNMRYGQDSYLWLNMIAQYDILRLHDVLVKVRMRGTNASRRAMVQLKARADIWEYRKTKPELLLKNKVSVMGRLAGNLCVFGAETVSVIEKIIKHYGMLEYIAKVFFVMPYVLSKLDTRSNGNTGLRKCT